MTYKEYPFPDNPMGTGYCVFPLELENDEKILFHATPFKNFESIIDNGFIIPATINKSQLSSVSFAKRSVGALTHAIERRQKTPGDYCIFAVEYETLEQLGLRVEIDRVFDHKIDPSPKIIGYCIIPQSYAHV